MSELTTYREVDEPVLLALRPPVPLYFLGVAVLAAGMTAFLTAWAYQSRMGMGVAGINHPVAWGVYITNFVFWVGIAHSGTFISAILHLVRSKWRNAVSRSSEAMTLFAIATAGMFPLVHLGRVWVFGYILPYPSQRQLWPNFTSPLVLDVMAISTYFTVSLIFFYVGLIPDLATAREWMRARYGPAHWRSRLYRVLAAGWCGSGAQWRHYGRAYLFFAALATPLVVSVHSVVSWDFALSILPGWHSIIFPPYFVAGAIHSGLAMVLTLIIPMRRLLKIESLVRLEHLEAVALTMLLTGAVVAYAYIVEPFMGWYKGGVERQFSQWQATGPLGWVFWLLPVLNVLVPATFLLRRLRRHVPWLFAAAILVNIGMWLERFFIITSATRHDFLPHNWGVYQPTWVEWTINFGALSMFLLFFVLFTKVLPVVPNTEVKEDLAENELERRAQREQPLPVYRGDGIARAKRGVLAVYRDASELMRALGHARAQQLGELEIFSPVKLGRVGPIVGLPPGPVRYWTLAGALAGIAGGLYLCIGTAEVNSLIVGGKPVRSIAPFLVVAFEGMVLLGAIFNLVGMFVHGRLGRLDLPRAYDPRFSGDRFALWVACEAPDAPRAIEVLRQTQPEELRELT